MLGSSLVVALLVQSAVVVSPLDSVKSAAGSDARPGATSAPVATADSLGGVSAMDARLLPAFRGIAASDTLPKRRRRSVEYSDWYYRRLRVHHILSWTELPVFATEYWLGNKLINDRELAGWVKPTHVAVATGLGGLFTVNTVTGLWNLYDSRQSTDDRALVWSHTLLMLAADAGFGYTALIAGDADEGRTNQIRHRNAALVSMSFATAGTLLMWVKRGL